jgi:hypothetical protein
MSDVLTQDQVSEAIDQATHFCADREAANMYEAISMRSVLDALGYETEGIEQVLQYCFDRGFTYCLDRRYHNSPHGNTVISQDVCYWSPDQLRSRLQSI